MSVTTMTPAFRTADRLRIRYAEAGRGVGQTVVLTSPWPESLFAFRKVWERLAQRFHVIAIDLPGFGQSDRRLDLYAPKAMGAFLVNLINEWQLGPVHFVGPDVGTSAQLWAAATNPDLVRSLVIGGGAMALPLQTGGPLKTIIEAPNMNWVTDSAQTLGPLYDAIPGGTPAEIKADYLASYAGDRFAESARYVRSYPAELPLLAEILPTIQTPVLLMSGANDELVPLVNAEFLHQRLPNSRMGMLQAGHFAWEEVSDQYADGLLDWIAGGYRELTAPSNITAPTQFVATKLETYAYRRFGRGAGPPLLCLQHFTGTLDFWDPAVVDLLARTREVILFENAGLGRSSGEVPDTMVGMAAHVLAFVDALGLTRVDVLGFSLGGVLAQLIALDRPSLVRKMLLVGTAPEGGEDIMHLEKPELKRILDDQTVQGLQRFVKLFFTPSESSQAAGQAYAQRLAARRQDREPLSGPRVAAAQVTAFRAWERGDGGERFAKLRQITQPCLVVNGVLDQMISVKNSYSLAEHLPRAMLLTYPDAGHGSLFQYHDSFVRQASLFLDSTTL